MAGRGWGVRNSPGSLFPEAGVAVAGAYVMVSTCCSAGVQTHGDASRLLLMHASPGALVRRCSVLCCVS